MLGLMALLEQLDGYLTLVKNVFYVLSFGSTSVFVVGIKFVFG